MQPRPSGDAGLAALAAGDPGRHAPWWATCAAGALPLFYYLGTASATGYWFDAGEFVAAARTLGISHPPGQPLSALVNGLFAALPVGTLSFRVAVASAVAMAVAMAFGFRAVYHGLTLVRWLHPWARALTSLAAIWAVSAGAGLWIQAVRPEVYALQTALAMVALDGLLRYERDAPEGNLPALYVASFAEALGLANHHFLALLLLPAAAPTLGRAWLRHGPRALSPIVGFALLGLCTYVYLPLRAQADPQPNFGEPTDLARLYWVVSAQAFQGAGALPSDSFGVRVADVAVSAVETLGWPLFVAGLCGLYVGFRTRALRPVAVIWGLVLAFGLLARAWLGFIRANPDAWGYLAGVYLALTAFAALFVAGVLQLVFARGRVAIAVSSLLALLSLWRLDASAQAADLSRFEATEHFDRLSRRALPQDAVLVLHEPQSIFRSLGREVELQERPDITIVPLPFLSYPGMVDALIEQAPELRALLRGYLLSGRLRQPDLQSLAAERPLYIEMDPRVPPDLYETLVPDRLFYRVLADGATDRDEQEGARRQALGQQALYAALGAAADAPPTEERLLWMHYTDALYYMGFGDHASAHRAIALGLSRAPRSEHLLAMQKALAATEKGPVDVRPFLFDAAL